MSKYMDEKVKLRDSIAKAIEEFEKNTDVEINSLDVIFSKIQVDACGIEKYRRINIDATVII